VTAVSVRNVADGSSDASEAIVRTDGQRAPVEAFDAGNGAEADGEGGRPKGRVVLGIDVSLVACGFVAVPLDWGGDWSRIRRRTYGKSLPNGASDRRRIERLENIAATAVDFAREHGCAVAAIESFPYGKATAAHSLGEASGVIKLELSRAGLDVTVSPISTARKLLLGSVPRKAVKLAVRDRLVALGAPFSTLDECDAFGAANYCIKKLGGRHIDGSRSQSKHT